MNDCPNLGLRKHGFALVAAGVLCLALCGFWVDRSLLEKLATQLALPCGLIGLALVGATYIAFRVNRRRYGIPALALLLFYWTAGSAIDQ